MSELFQSFPVGDVESVRQSVSDDYRRIREARDPFTVLGLSSGAPMAEVRARYERFERFYRPDNFQPLDDMELTRKALVIRRAIGQAMSEIHESAPDEEPSTPAQSPGIDPDLAALADIYHRDGLTWLKLGDMGRAAQMFHRSLQQLGGRGSTEAYLAYCRYREQAARHDGHPEECRQQLDDIALRHPNDPDVHVVLARFALHIAHMALAITSVERVAMIRPNHPMLVTLRQRIERLRAQQASSLPTAVA